MGSSSALPLGTIVAIYGPANSPPPGWLLCNGGDIDASDYPDLYQRLNGKLPDLRQRVVVGAGGGYAQGSYVGAAEVTLAIENMPSHQHYGMGTQHNEDWLYGVSKSMDEDGQGFRGAEQSDTSNYLYGSTWAGGTGKNDIPVSGGKTTSSGPSAAKALDIVPPSFAVNSFIYAGSPASDV